MNHRVDKTAFWPNAEMEKTPAMSFSVNPLGIPAAQTWLQIVRHFEIIEKYDIQLFIEIGVYLGGLTSLMLSRVDYVSNFSYLGVDIDLSQIDSRVTGHISRLGNRAKIIHGDSMSPKIQDIIRERCHSFSGTVYLFCDGGEKPEEVIAYHQLIKRGDLIAVHDYGDNPNAPVKPKDLEVLSGLEEIEPKQFRQQCQMPLFKKVVD